MIEVFNTASLTLCEKIARRRLISPFFSGLRLVIAYKLPWILRGLWSIVKHWLGPQQKLIQFANGSEEVKQFIAEENLPRYLGGTCTTNFIEAPKCCQPVANLAHLHGFTPEEVEKYMKIFSPHIEEAKQLVSI